MRHAAKRKRNRNIWLYLLFWVFIILMFSGITLDRFLRYNEYKQELAALDEALAAEQQTTYDLQAQIEYYNSDAYIEQLAREQLGFVMPDEIVFINTAD